MEHDTLVVRWAHHNFETPLPLVPRHSIQVGDIVDSSHYGKVKVTNIATTERRNPEDSIQFFFARQNRDGEWVLPEASAWSERYPGNLRVPVYEQACRTTEGCVYTEGHRERSADFPCRVETP